ncbi:MAG TPA: hypothetical protein PLM07_09670 [Candidatus Rifleibacterium sp.]|nr:hypothetical protein [Candidatus Rifleibacterium sp.]HPT46157.1 hypothetical protein [Candidatus Rifleibacterium sp.]
MNKIAAGNREMLTGLFKAETNKVNLCLETEIPSLVKQLLGLKFSGSENNDVHERFCLYVFLIGCFKSRFLAGNLTIAKQESPDFVITSADGKLEIGLEHTRATVESYQIARREYLKRKDGCVLELFHYSPFKPLSNKGAGVGISQPGAKLKGKGWKGNEAELEWAETMIQAINKKVETLNKSHFQQKHENHLIVEDDTPVDFVKENKTAFELLRNRYSKDVCTKYAMFHKIHILSNCILLYDFFGEAHEIDIHKAHLQNLTNIEPAQSNLLAS